MSTKTKWLGAGAVVVLIIVAVALITRGDDAGSSEKTAAPPIADQAATPDAGAAAAPKPVPPDAVAQAMSQAFPDGGGPSRPYHASRFPQPPNPAMYRPARYLIYSDDEVSQNKTRDEDNWAFKRIVEVTEPSPKQLDEMKALWRKHEDGRRELWEQAGDRRSGPRILDADAVRRLDSTFETELLSKVFDEDQGQRMLEEVPPRNASGQ